MVDYDKLVEVLERGATEHAVALLSQLSCMKSNLCSAVAQLCLQLAVYYGHPSLVDATTKYKVVCLLCVFVVCVCVCVCVAWSLCAKGSEKACKWTL